MNYLELLPDNLLVLINKYTPYSFCHEILANLCIDKINSELILFTKVDLWINKHRACKLTNYHSYIYDLHYHFGNAMETIYNIGYLNNKIRIGFLKYSNGKIYCKLYI